MCSAGKHRARGGGSCAPPGPAAAPTPISCTPGRGLGWAGGRGWGHRSCPVLIGDGGAGGPGSVPAAGMERRPTGRAARHPARPPAGGGAGGPEGRGAAGPANNPPSSLSAPCLRCGCATVGRSWGRREPSAAGRGGEPRGGGGWRPFRFAHPSWNGRLWPGRPRGSAPPCGITAAGTAAPVSCVQTRNCVYDPPRGEGRGSGPASALGEPRPTPPTPGPDSFPALQDRSRSPRAPRSPPRALLPVKLNAIPRRETLKGTFRAKSHFFPPLPLCRSAGGREGQCN